MTEMSTTEIDFKLMRLSHHPLGGEEDFQFVFDHMPELQDIIARYDKALEPCGHKRAIKELTRLKVALPHTRKLDKASRDIFISEAGLVPIFALREFVSNWYKKERFWPSIAEMNEATDNITRPHSDRRKELRRMLEEVSNG